MTTLDNIWERLNEEGIYTKEQLKKELSKYKLEIGMFTTPIEANDAV